MSRLHNRIFLHWMVALVRSILEVATLIHIGHLQNLYFDEVHSAHHLSQLTFIVIYPGFVTTHLICYESDIGRYVLVP